MKKTISQKVQEKEPGPDSVFQFISGMLRSPTMIRFLHVDKSPQKCCHFHAMGIVTVWGKINTRKTKGERFSSTRHTFGG